MPEWLVALDRSSGELGPRGNGSEREFRLEGTGGDVPARPSEPVEPVRRAECRARAEYYEVLRAAADGADRGGWNEIPAADRPPAEGIRMSPERATHILDGEPGGGGGHRHGTGRSGKTEFPASWDDKKIMDNAMDAARRPDDAPTLQHWNDRWICAGTREDVEVSVIVLRSGEVWTSWPEEGSPGVVRNP
jgi:Bacterial EndoU nuclease